MEGSVWLKATKLFLNPRIHFTFEICSVFDYQGVFNDFVLSPWLGISVSFLKSRLPRNVQYTLFITCMCATLLQLSLTLCDPMDCSSPGSSVHGILQARTLEWVAMSFSRTAYLIRGFPCGTSGKEPTCQCGRHKRCGLNLWVKKTLWRRAWQPTPVFLPDESHGQRSLVSSGP